MREKDKMPTPEEAQAALARGKRYWSLNYSVSAHCCFEATVIDLKDGPDIIGGYGTVCECFEHAHARRIAQAMNEKEKS
jgi:hypothetical protein